MNDGLSPQDLDLLCKFDTPTICNVIEVFDVRSRTAGYMDARIKACYPEMTPVVGYATTATWRAVMPGGSYAAALDSQVARFEELSSPLLVVFQDLDDPPVAASFGEIMCATYQAFGASALVTSGAARDLEQVRSLGFPVFSNGVICSHGYGHIGDVNVPVHVGGIVVEPGDLLHADVNGVTTIPSEIARDVAHACTDYVAAEQVIIDYLGSATITADGLAEARAECKRRLEVLEARVR